MGLEFWIFKHCCPHAYNLSLKMTEDILSLRNNIHRLEQDKADLKRKLDAAWLEETKLKHQQRGGTVT